MYERSNNEPYPGLLCNIGLIDYTECLEMQESLRRRVISDPFTKGILLFLKHPHTITHGRLALRENLLVSTDELTDLGVDVHLIDRGGDFTYHGPGQLVAYPIFDLNKLGMNIRQYCNALEEVIIRTLAGYDLAAGRINGYMGTWVGEEKICAIGVGVRKWVTKHGLAFNVNTDLGWFEKIIPCGISEFGVTSLAELTGKRHEMADVTARVRESFIDVFNLELDDISIEVLNGMIDG